MEGLAGCTTASDLVMLLRTLVCNRLSGPFLRWALITGKRGEALGGTGPFWCTRARVLLRPACSGVPDGVYPGCTGGIQG